MSVHISEEIRNKYPQYEFIGKPFTLRNGKTYIRAYHKGFFDKTHIYDFEKDWFWHDTAIGDLIKIKI